MRRAVILQPRCELYRTTFYERLRTLLASKDVSLDLIYGESNDYDAVCTGHVTGAIEVPSRYLYFGKRFLVWQPVLRHIRGADLVIIQQNSANLINYPILILRKLRVLRVALWGHGRCLQAGERRPIREAFKAWYSKQVDYWFAYTDLSRDLVEQLGFPAEKITVVNNAIDSGPLIAQYDRTMSGDDRALRVRLGIPEDARVGLYCGRFYADKRLRFLFEAASEVRRRCLRFHLVIIGEGTSEREVVDYAQANSEWIHFVGPKYGIERVPYFRIAACQLNPGLVGLGIVDSFAMLTPIITTDNSIHSPEIAYLKNGLNGIMTPNLVSAYSDAVLHYLNDEQYQATLRSGCYKARDAYTVEEMANRFAAGVMQALN
jgi:glycosyltransferase involved in cell wall biosynthesis